MLTNDKLLTTFARALALIILRTMTSLSADLSDNVYPLQVGGCYVPDVVHVQPFTVKNRVVCKS